MEETQSVLDIPGIEMAEEKAPEQEVPQEPPKKPKKTEYSTDFQRFWRIYPRKDGKGEAYKKYKARLMMDGHPMNCAKRLKITRKNWFEREQRVNT